MMAYKKNDVADAVDDGVTTDPEEEALDDGMEPLVPGEEDDLMKEGDVSGFEDED